jgi:glyoxylase-like metal-dependent hydrolase (beta-lactamase superfamily II)
VTGAGKYRLQAIATPGHAADHLAFALLGSDLLFSGDHVMGWSTTVVAPPDGSMADYVDSLDKLLARPECRYFPAHGGAIRDGPALVRGLKAHRKMREAAILEGLARGDRTIPQLVARVYKGLSPQLGAAAALSTLAHLQDLAERRQVRSDGPCRVDGRYSPAGASSEVTASRGDSSATPSSGTSPPAAPSLGGGGGAGGGASDAS